MMISPEGYYEEYLKEKTKGQIMSAIRGLKQEIGRLKITIESPDYGQEQFCILVKIPEFTGLVNIWKEPS